MSTNLWHKFALSSPLMCNPPVSPSPPHWSRLLINVYFCHFFKSVNSWGSQAGMEIFIFHFESRWEANKWIFCWHTGKKVISLFRNLECEGTLSKPLKTQGYDSIKWDSSGLKELILSPMHHRFTTWREQGMREEWRLTFKRKNIFLFPLPDTSWA